MVLNVKTGDATRGTFTITTDSARFDIGAIHAFLSEAYWSEGIPEPVVRRAIAGSLAFGVLDGEKQVGFARVITDRATYAYLSDVYVLEEYRGQGLATWLVETIIAHPDLQGLRRFALSTRDAHDLYRKFGFTEMARPDRQMEILRAGLYQAALPVNGE